MKVMECLLMHELIKAEVMTMAGRRNEEEDVGNHDRTF